MRSQFNLTDELGFLFTMMDRSRGDACPFAHVAKEKIVPVANGPKRCFTWAKKGKCRKGDRCKYAHT